MTGERYEGYVLAGDIVTERWTRMTYGSYGYERCLMGAINEAGLVPVHDFVPGNKSAHGEVVREEIARKLRWSPWYRIMALVSENQHVAERWNDAPWRRRKRVIKLLHQLAEDQRIPWLENERIVLQLKVERLTGQITQLRARIVELESENAGYVRSLMNSRQLQADRSVLEILDRELDESAAKLGAL